MSLTDPTAGPATDRPSPTVGPDHRPGRGVGAAALMAGGLLFAIGNALHPLEHSDAAATAPTWAAAHLIFAAGALLLVGGVAALAHRLADSRTGTAGLVLTAAGMVFVVGSAYVEVFVAPVVGHATMDRIEDGAAAWSAVTVVTFVLGPVLVALAGWRRRRLPRAACAAILVAQTLLLVGPALPVAEGWTIIPASMVLGVALAALGWAVHPRGTV